jgi:hypothetical protein
MNFEIKSTFNNILITLFNTLTFVLRPKNARWVLLFNIATSFTAFVLYYTNLIIPATIGSLPRGALCVTIIENIIAFKLVSSAYASLIIIAQIVIRRFRLNEKLSATHAVLTYRITIAAGTLVNRIQRNRYWYIRKIVNPFSTVRTSATKQL